MAETPTTSTTSAAPGIRALLTEIVDYAGIFPPASLPLGEAVRRFAEYRRSPQAWMLARFVIPARRLREVVEYADLFESGPPLRLSILPTGGDDEEAFLRELEQDLDEIERFRDHLRTRAVIEQVEARMPQPTLDTDVVSVGRFLKRTAGAIAGRGMDDADIFFEVPMDDFLHQRLPLLTGAASSFNKGRSDQSGGAAGAKMRTGGTEADAFPPAEDVAFVIASCRNAGIPFKATAGLHHPFRRIDRSIGAKMHGFLNVFGAAVLASAHALSEEEIASILVDEETSHFRFTSNGFEWTHHGADLHTVERIRSEKALSFGSCSFQEPIDDLTELGLL